MSVNNKKEPILKAEIFVDEHLTKEVADQNKPDVFTVSFKTTADGCKVGMADASVKMKIKAIDEIVKEMFRKNHTFEIWIFPKIISKPNETDKTVPTRLQPE